jgi:hypothetical protein
MTTEDRFKEMYKSGFTPWDIGKADFNLVEVVTQKPILSCKAIDIGCGTGDNSSGPTRRKSGSSLILNAAWFLGINGLPNSPHTSQTQFRFK